MTTLGRELKNRGHQVTLFGILDIEAKVQSEGLEFQPIGQSDHPLGSLSLYQDNIGKLSGLAVMRFAFRTVQQANTMIFRDAPHAMRKIGVEALLVDEAEPVGGTISDYLKIPFITISSGLPSNREARIPPNVTHWKYHPNWWCDLRNQAGYSIFDWLTRSIAKDIAQQRYQWKLPPYRVHDDSFSQLAQISQIPAEFDWPRKALPKCFHYTGPFRRSSIRDVSFPYERLTGQPLIYASLGTVVNRNPKIFDCIATACSQLEAQLVLSLGGGSNAKDYQDLPGKPLVVEYAPQMKLLERAKLAITHAGLNSTLESLSEGIPMVAIPNTADQPGVAARLSWTGAGEVVPLKYLSVYRLRTAVKRVLKENSYRTSALRLKESISRAGGVTRAADIAEQVIATKRPVLANPGLHLEGEQIS